jgi:hypothetical protein
MCCTYFLMSREHGNLAFAAVPHRYGYVVSLRRNWGASRYFVQLDGGGRYRFGEEELQKTAGQEVVDAWRAAQVQGG